MSKNLKIWAIRAGLLAMPFVGMAAGSLDTALNKVLELSNWIIQILFVAVTAYFFWGVIQYVMAGGKDDAITAGRNHMLWGLIGMAAMLAAWGIVKAIISYFGFEGGGGIPEQVQ